jgi:hypothetical protein
VKAWRGDLFKAALGGLYEIYYSEIYL